MICSPFSLAFVRKDHEDNEGDGGEGLIKRGGGEKTGIVEKDREIERRTRRSRRVDGRRKIPLKVFKEERKGDLFVLDVKGRDVSIWNDDQVL